MLMLRLLKETSANFVNPEALALAVSVEEPVEGPVEEPEVDKIHELIMIAKAVQDIQHWVESASFADEYSWVYYFEEQNFSIISLQDRAESILGMSKGQICKNI
jgi:hypothetical protein